MPIKVYHARLPEPPFPPGDGTLRLPAGRLEDLAEDQLQLIAHMRTGHFEEAFVWSQHVEHVGDHPWQEDAEHVLYLHPGPYPVGSALHSTPRSTSVGDVLENCDDFTRFLVAPVGFMRLPPRPAPPLQFPRHPVEWRKLLVQVWDVALAWRLIALRSSQGPDGYANLQQYRPEDLGGWLGVDEAQAMSDATDLRVPIFIVPMGEDPVEYTPIDGHHRIFKGLREGRTRLPTYRLTPLEGAVVDETAARFGNRTHVTRYHTCGQRLTRYTQTHGKQRFIWLADEATPLLTHCPGCGQPLTPNTLRVHRPQ